MGPKRVEVFIVIWLCTACNWLLKLEYEYRDMRKDVFIDGHKWPNVVEDQINFLQKIEELKPYIVEFEENDIIKPKVYPADCAIGRNNQQLVIIITHNEYTFLANNEIQKVWTQKDDTFLRPKGQRQDIMVSEFIFSYG